MRILIAGTGAMGASFGSLLKNSGNEVVFLDNWDKNIESIRIMESYLIILIRKKNIYRYI